MLSIIYQIPMGLIETDLEGNIQQMNAKSIQLLMPQFFSYGLNGTNFHSLLAFMAPNLLSTVTDSPVISGCIINQQRQEVVFNDATGKTSRHFIFTVNRLDEKSLMYLFDDITELYLKEKLINQILQDKAVEQSKFEIASGVLHDIGNAVVGFGSYLTKIKRNVLQNETGTLEKLKEFITKNYQGLSETLGEKKASALGELLNGVILSQNAQTIDINRSISDQMKIISHVQEILNIQRQYVFGQSTDRLPVNIRSVINDSIAMLFGTLDKKNIAFHFDAPAVNSKLNADRTQLMQVFLNLLKNAVDSFDGINSDEKEINVTVIEEEQKICILIQDNGIGFNEEIADKLFTRGFTSKKDGTGLGLDNCKKIIEAHNGELSVTSDGLGKGAVSKIIFYL